MGLSNDYERINFSIDVVKCNYSKQGCADDEQIEKMLNNVFFKVHTIVERVEF